MGFSDPWQPKHVLTQEIGRILGNEKFLYTYKCFKFINTYMHIYIHVYIYVYIYIYIRTKIYVIQQKMTIL
jgi:hypothetical protein